MRRGDEAKREKKEGKSEATRFAIDACAGSAMTTAATLRVRRSGRHRHRQNRPNPQAVRVSRPQPRHRLRGRERPDGSRTAAADVVLLKGWQKSRAFHPFARPNPTDAACARARGCHEKKDRFFGGRERKTGTSAADDARDRDGGSPPCTFDRSRVS